MAIRGHQTTVRIRTDLVLSSQCPEILAGELHRLALVISLILISISHILELKQLKICSPFFFWSFMYSAESELLE